MCNTDDLPDPGHEHVTNADPQHRVRSLYQGDVEALTSHESCIGNRAGAPQRLGAHVERLRDGARPSPGAADSAPSREPHRVENTSGPHTDTVAPPVHPPRHGVPGGLPRRPGREPG